MANQVVYGFQDLVDVFSQRVTTVGVSVVNEAVGQSFAAHQEQMNAMLALFTTKTEQFQIQYSQDVVLRSQPLDEFGRPLPVKGGAKYTVAFPMGRSGNRLGWTYDAFQYVTVGEVNDKVRAIQLGDMRWLFDNVLASIFTNTTWTYYDEAHGDLTIQPLANGDAVVYGIVSGNDVGATDTHYMAQANAIGAGADNPFPAIYADLIEHPENGTGPIIVFAPTNLVSTITALGTFTPVSDTNIRLGANSDLLVGNLGVTVPGGDRMILGYEDARVWIVQYPRLPSNYLVAIATGGQPPLAMREPEPANLKGFAEIPPEADPSPYPYLHRTWVRRAGFGGWNRTAGLVYRIGNGAYAIPTNYTAPLA